MANICSYRVIVNGKKNSCYAFLGSMSCLDNKEIVNESGNDQDYTLHFEGNCKWAVDYGCNTPWEGDFPVKLPDDYEEAREIAEIEYWYNTVQERSKMFEVEVWCNSADIEDSTYELFEHYKNGVSLGGKCPEEIAGIVDTIEEFVDMMEEGYLYCEGCAEVFPEEELINEDDYYYCKDCYSEMNLQ